jgi:outer membrane protein assembly factor BamB
MVADPIVFEDKVVLTLRTGSDTGSALLDISSREAKFLWRKASMNNDISSSVLVDGYLYGCHGNARYGEAVLRCVDVLSGEVMWDKYLEQRRPMCLSAAGDKLIILGDRGMLHIAYASSKAYEDISSAQLFKEQKLVYKCWTSPVLCDGKIYCNNDLGDLVCIDIRR